MIDRVAITKQLFELGAPMIPMNGKFPINPGWTKGPPITLGDALDWIKSGKFKNLGIRTGRTQGCDMAVICIDFDHPTMKEIRAEYKRLGLPKTWMISTGGGGIHAYFRTPPEPILIRNTQGAMGKRGLGESIDVRGQGGVAVAPGSIHPKTGSFYEWAPGCGPYDLELADLPTAIIDKLVGACSANGFQNPDPVDVENFPPVSAGSRHGASTRLAGALIGMNLSRAEIVTRMKAWNDKNTPPMDSTELMRVIDDLIETHKTNSPLGRRGARLVMTNGALAAGKVQDDQYLGFTDLDHAERMHCLFGHGIRWCPELLTWMIWDGKVLAPDRTGEMMRLARRGAIHARGLTMGGGGVDPELSKAVKKSVARLSSLSAMKSAVEMLKSEPGITVPAGSLDTNPLLLSCRNGTVDLAKGRTQTHKIEHLITRRIDISFDPKAECPIWDRAIDEIFAYPDGTPDPKTVAYFQRMLGYCLTGDVSEDAFFVWYGTGANGKSLVLEAMQEILGEFMVATPFSTFTDKGEEREKMYQRALFHGSRVVASSEMKVGSPLDEAQVKSLTGRDKVTARHFMGPPFQFDPTHKIILVTNHLPRIKGGDHGIWRRVQLLPFQQCFDAAQGRPPDPDLPRKLRIEAEGILAWMVRGALAWLAQGLNPTRRCQMAAEDYRESEDVTGGFFDDVGWVVPEQGATTLYKDLWESYETYCERETVEQVRTQRTFKDLISERGYRRKRMTEGQTVFGMRLGNDARQALIQRRGGSIYGDGF